MGHKSAWFLMSQRVAHLGKPALALAQMSPAYGVKTRVPQPLPRICRGMRNAESRLTPVCLEHRTGSGGKVSRQRGGMRHGPWEAQALAASVGNGKSLLELSRRGGRTNVRAVILDAYHSITARVGLGLERAVGSELIGLQRFFCILRALPRHPGRPVQPWMFRCDLHDDRRQAIGHFDFHEGCRRSCKRNKSGESASRAPVHATKRKAIHGLFMGLNFPYERFTPACVRTKSISSGHSKKAGVASWPWPSMTFTVIFPPPAS